MFFERERERIHKSKKEEKEKSFYHQQVILVSHKFREKEETENVLQILLMCPHSKKVFLSFTILEEREKCVVIKQQTPPPHTQCLQKKKKERSKLVATTW